MGIKYINYSDELLCKYFKDIKKLDLLTPEEEIELSEKIKDGDDKALNKLIQSNLKFVVDIAKEFQFNGLDINDLINDGNEGLIKAALRFDHTKGFRFISYAIWWIRQSIIQSLNDNSRIVRLPVNVINDILSDKRTFSDGSDSKLNISDYCLTDKPVFFSDLESDDLSNILIKDNDSGFDDTRDLVLDELHRVLGVLPERERDIIKLYYGFDDEHPMTLEKIAEKYDLTKERVRQIKDSSIKKLRYEVGELSTIINYEKN